jgi:hypothetical protein
MQYLRGKLAPCMGWKSFNVEDVLHAEGYSVEGWAGAEIRKSGLQFSSFLPKAIEAIRFLWNKGPYPRLTFF